MIKVIQFPPMWDLPNVSPFCMKLETYLRMANIPFEAVNALNPRRSPKGKFPYIIDGDKKIADSSFIIDYLKSKYNNTLDADLTSSQRAIALAFQRMLEEHYYWVVLYARWADDQHWPFIKRSFFGRKNSLKVNILSKIVRKKLLAQAHAAGIARHSLEEVYKMGFDDISAVSYALGEQKFFLGVNPSSIDAVIYAFMANTLWAPFDNPLKHHAMQFQNLVDYCQRMKDKFYGVKE